jgi:hypothetical protein
MTEPLKPTPDAEKWTKEEVYNAIGEMGTALAELFTREGKALTMNLDERSLGRQEAYLACAEACVKATTRKMVIDIRTFTPSIKFSIPAEAKP